MTHAPAYETTRKIASDALLREYDFVESLIPLYRQFQMQLIHSGLLLYVALLGLVAVRVGADLLPKVLHATLGIIAYPIAFLLLGFATTEVRIMRASRHVSEKVAPLVQDLCRPFDPITWEHAPGGTLNKLEKMISTSLSFILILAAPALVASVWYIFFTKTELQIVGQVWPALGLLVLFFAAAMAAYASCDHELRTRKINPLLTRICRLLGQAWGSGYQEEVKGKL